MEEDNSEPSGEIHLSKVIADVSITTRQFFADNISISPNPNLFSTLQQQLVDYLAEKFSPPSIDGNSLEYIDIGHIARDYGTVMLFNYLNLPSFCNIPKENRAIFLPECLTARRKCAAIEHERYISCAHCGACKIDWLVDLTSSYGYSEELSFIVSGGSAIPALINQKSVKALVGVACYNELYAFLELFKELDSPPPAQMILLTKWGCRNTRFTASQAQEVFDSIKQYEESSG